MRFVADSMLGKLARYLRIMGYDTVYQETYTDQRLSDLVEEGRVLLTRSNARFSKYSDSIFIDRDLVRDQLQAVDRKIGLNRDQNKWFTRCSVCNAMLSEVDREVARQHVPDFVLLSYPQKVRFCPRCERFYWPGTHRERMLARLKNWGF
jgi:uncharacterized protein with PIN domain